MAAPELNGLLQSHNFAEAVARINKRAERQLDPAKLVEIFVHTDLPLRCETTDHQLVLGRRGTGKTHLLRFFQYEKQVRGEVAYYCDCTTLGSGIPSASVDPVTIATKYFVALLNDLGTYLLDLAIDLEAPDKGVQDHILNSLSSGLIAFAEPSSKPGDPIFNYRQISSTLRDVLGQLDVNRLFLVLDEWAQIPLPAQPYMAEFVKRALLTVPTISIKILAVNYQCKFSEQIAGNVLGMQRGADFTDVVEIDRYFVFDENNAPVTLFFAQLLYNHLGAELAWDLTLPAQAKLRAIIRLFTQEPAFTELVRAAEGNCRDLICIFSKAYLEGFRQARGATGISIAQVCNAAAAWYTSEKESNIRSEAAALETINFLLDRVLRGYRSRTFLVEVGKEDHPRIIRLLNERILHRLNAVYSHPDRPGLRYEIYTLDFGAYVRYRGTVNEPVQEIFFDPASPPDLPDEKLGAIVPLDDKRSIRRIVFDPDRLEVASS